VTEAILEDLDRDYLQQIGIAIVAHQVEMLHSLHASPDDDAPACAPPGRWSVRAWLAELELDRYADMFERHQISTEARLLALDRGDIRAVGVDIVAHIMIIERALY
jgi:hypothetical protein